MRKNYISGQKFVEKRYLRNEHNKCEGNPKLRM